MELTHDIPLLVTPEMGEALCREPTLEEVKQVIFSMDLDSTAGPGSFNAFFYYKC